MNSMRGVWQRHISHYPSPKYLNYNWGFGSILGLIVALQIITGILLACYYRPAEQFAFNDIMFIISDVNSGYFLKYLHLNGATAIFLLLYLHMFRGIYYKSYLTLPKVWLTGMILFVLMIITAFLGYVLPWGQMSFWAATVITNLITSLPVIGQKIIIYLHGAFSVQGATLNRFFVLHYLLALVSLAVIFLHLAYLHAEGSSNPVARVAVMEKNHFYYYFAYKDLQFFLVTCFGLCVAVFLFPNIFNHPDNFNTANPLVTPSHIVPEWYFLPFHAISRAIPNKLVGVLAMALSLVLLFFLPILSKTKFINYNFAEVMLDGFFYIILLCYLVLGYLGSMPAEAPYVFMSQMFTFIYFVSFGVVFFSGQILFLLSFFSEPALRLYEKMDTYENSVRNIPFKKVTKRKF